MKITIYIVRFTYSYYLENYLKVSGITGMNTAPIHPKDMKVEDLKVEP